MKKNELISSLVTQEESKVIDEICRRMAQELQPGRDPFIFWLKKFILTYSPHYTCPDDLKNHIRPDIALLVQNMDIALPYRLLQTAQGIEIKQNTLPQVLKIQNHLEQILKEMARVKTIEKRTFKIMLLMAMVTILSLFMLIYSLAFKQPIDQNIFLIPVIFVFAGYLYYKATRVNYTPWGNTLKIDQEMKSCKHAVVQLYNSLANESFSMINQKFKMSYQSHISELNQMDLPAPLKVDGEFYHTLRVIFNAREMPLEEHTCIVCWEEFAKDFSDTHYSVTEIKSPEESPWQGPYHEQCFILWNKNKSKDPLNQRLIRVDEIGLPILMNLAMTLSDFTTLELEHSIKSGHYIKLKRDSSISLEVGPEKDLENERVATEVSENLRNRTQPSLWNERQTNSDSAQSEQSTSGLHIKL